MTLFVEVVAPGATSIELDLARDAYLQVLRADIGDHFQVAECFKAWTAWHSSKERLTLAQIRDTARWIHAETAACIAARKLLVGSDRRGSFRFRLGLEPLQF